MESPCGDKIHQDFLDSLSMTSKKKLPPFKSRIVEDRLACLRLFFYCFSNYLILFRNINNKNKELVLTFYIYFIKFSCNIWKSS